MYYYIVVAMEDGEEKKVVEESSSPSPEKQPEVKVNVITPFKPGIRVSRVVKQGKCYYHPAKPATYVCASCSKSVCTVCGRDIGGAYFCPQCAPPDAPAPVYESAPQSKPKADTSWYKALLSVGVILILIGALLFLVYWPLSSMSAAEYENLMDEYYKDPDGPNGSATGGHNIPDYRPGDSITIKDKIVRIEFENDPEYGVVTLIWFESTGKDDTDSPLRFDADLERDYHVGDVVSITLHVDENPRTHDEIIREYDDNLPDISNIDHAISVDLVFLATIAIGAFLVVLYYMFTKKAKESEEDAKDTKSKSDGFSES
jgi:hypothetical protein